MVASSPSRTFWSRCLFLARALIVTAPLAAVTLYLYAESRAAERLLLEAETARQADSMLLQVQSFVSAHLDALKSAANFVTADRGAERSADYDQFVRQLLSEVHDFASIDRLDGRGSLLHRMPPGSGNPPPVGPAEFAALTKALSTREPAATASLDLPNGRKGALIVVPIPPEDTSEGALAGTIELTSVIQDLFSGEGPDLWNVELGDRAGRRIFRTPGTDTPRANAEATRTGTVRHVAVADRAWVLRVWPTPALAASLGTASPQWILLIGVLATLVVGVANVLLVQREDRLREALADSERLGTDRDAARRRLSELVNGIEAAVWESDATSQRVTFVNNYALKLLGIDAERWAANPASWLERVHPEDRAKATQHLQVAQHPGQTFPEEYRMISTGGEVIWVREIVTVIGGQTGEILGRRGVVVDITARVQAEEALRQSQKLESLGVLAGGIAHDFNNLLTTILGNAEMLRPWLANQDAKVSAHLEKIERTTRRLAELTRQMLAYSGRGEFAVAAVNLNLIISEMIELLTVSTPKNVQLIYRLDPSLPQVRADAAQMRQVILNLLTNASEAIGDHRPGEVTLRTSVTRLDATQIDEAFAGQDLEPGSFVTLEVSDTGSGMSAETLSKIFDPFFTTKFIGRGLGLAALRGIIRSHRGGIRIFTHMGRGTVFTLVFPAMVRLDEQTLRDHRPPAQDAGKADSTILLVDDEESLRSLMASAMESAGCRVIQAIDGVDGIEAFRRHIDDIDVTVLDLTMPRLNGDEVFRQIMDVRPDALVILISGYTQEDVASHFTGHRVAGYLEKPFAPSELLAKVREVLRFSRQTPASTRSDLSNPDDKGKVAAHPDPEPSRHRPL